jgi:hypothetical protein
MVDDSAGERAREEKRRERERQMPVERGCDLNRDDVRVEKKE